MTYVVNHSLFCDTATRARRRLTSITCLTFDICDKTQAEEYAALIQDSGDKAKTLHARLLVGIMKDKRF